MNHYRQITGIFLTAAVAGALCMTGRAEESGSAATKEYIETTLNLANNENQEWTYLADADAWILSVVPAVAYPELPDQQGVSVCVPGAYITGIDTNGDGLADVTSQTCTEAVKGGLVIDYDAQVTSTNGQIYTAKTAPVILNTGAAGYGSSANSTASTIYAADGYINIACGNRGKQDTAVDDDGNTYYTGDAPSCLVDQKAAARYVKYNILLGNLPGSTDYFVSTGGSGGGAHAAMFAATSNNPDFYDYQIEAGAVGVYLNDDGSYSTTVTIDGTDYELSDGAWGCIAYSAITSLYEADMALAFEYYMDTTYEFNTPFQSQLAQYLSEAYMEYINSQNLSVAESAVGFDLNQDGDLDDVILLTIEYSPEDYPETNGYHGTYLDLYLAEFTENLQWYLDNLDYAKGWTWFDESGNALSDEDVAAMTSAEKAQAFIEGRYAKDSSGGKGRPGDLPSGMGGAADFAGKGKDGTRGGKMAGGKAGDMADGANPGNGPDGTDFGDIDGGNGNGNRPDGTDLGDIDGGNGNGNRPDGTDLSDIDSDNDPGNRPDDTDLDDIDGGPAFGNRPDSADLGDIDGDKGMIVGTPDGGTTQSASGSTDSANYSSYEDMVAAYEADIESISAGDKYGNDIVALYNPLNYIGQEDTEAPVWTRIIMGAAEGDMSMFSSLNLQIAWLNAGTDAVIEWQWDGGHVPSEIFGNSLALYVDQMYGEYAEGANTITKPEATAQTENGTATEATGTDLSAWVDTEDITNVSFSLADAAAYRTNGASKATPGFDVIDYGQEDYVFGNTESDARHWNKYLLAIFRQYTDVLKPLFNNQ